MRSVPDRCRRVRAVLTLTFACLFLMSAVGFCRDRWTPEQAHAWYAKQPWLVGCNYIPSNAINQLEMWQADTFDPATIDRELGWAASLGFTSVRVFLHDLLWQQDREGFLKRLDQFLAIAERHHIGVMLVPLDGVWDPQPGWASSGPQAARPQFRLAAEPRRRPCWPTRPARGIEALHPGPDPPLLH